MRPLVQANPRYAAPIYALDVRVEADRAELARARYPGQPTPDDATATAQRAERQQRLDQRERDRPDRPLTMPVRADRARSARVDERERGGREREAG